MRPALLDLIAAIVAVGLFATMTGSSYPAHEVVAVRVGDTLQTYFSIQTDSVLAPPAPGEHGYAVAKHCGLGKVYLRLLLHGQRVTNDTVLVSVTGCPAPDTTTAPASAEVWSDVGGHLAPFDGSSGPINGPAFCVYVVERTTSGRPLTGHKIKKWNTDDRTIFPTPGPACPDTTIDPAQWAPAGVPAAPGAFPRGSP